MASSFRSEPAGIPIRVTRWKVNLSRFGGYSAATPPPLDEEGWQPYADLFCRAETCHHLDTSGCSYAPQSLSGVAHCCNEVVCELQTLATPRTTEKVIFKNRNLLFRQSTREVRVDRFIRIGWAAINLHTLMLMDSGFLDKYQNI
jgi:hypothetical protein